MAAVLRVRSERGRTLLGWLLGLRGRSRGAAAAELANEDAVGGQKRLQFSDTLCQRQRRHAPAVKRGKRQNECESDAQASTGRQARLGATGGPHCLRSARSLRQAKARSEEKTSEARRETGARSTSSALDALWALGFAPCLSQR